MPTMVGPGQVDRFQPEEAQIGGSMIKCGLEFFGGECTPWHTEPLFDSKYQAKPCA